MLVWSLIFLQHWTSSAIFVRCRKSPNEIITNGVKCQTMPSNNNTVGNPREYFTHCRCGGMTEENPASTGNSYIGLTLSTWFSVVVVFGMKLKTLQEPTLTNYESTGFCLCPVLGNFSFMGYCKRYRSFFPGKITL